ncbi:MAG: SDR family NAD(P)-dependent oxidoreductase [Gammaproteobacteria bacterium]|nr:SDR family NAD(P)-dependent oxidoreductase [Gammaproteobacteria bacterium]MDH4253319.1 SDR family NAD(P)-dependent oxidoreductase [Gammaproteobacteria bacterium]MDH5309928.1 SDR family NAD(P)-dependent oxidoreductase [Gammaproteobacteria bacterium]
MQDVTGKTAFITGGAHGVGYGMAHAFLEAGMNVVIGDIRGDALEAAVRRLGKIASPVHGIRVDITDRDAMARAADEAEASFGKVHVLCNNAGINVFGPIDEASYDDWDWLMDVNLNAVFNGIKSFLPKIKAHGEGGHIINTASMASLVSGPGAGIYTAAKFAVRGFSECLWYNLVPQGIGVSVVCPGLVNSNIHHSEELRPDSRKNVGHPQDAGFVSRLEQIQPLGMDPLEMGAKILRGLKRGDLYIMTHPEHKDEVARDFAEILAAFPDEPADPKRLEVEHMRQKMKYDIKNKYSAAHDD